MAGVTGTLCSIPGSNETLIMFGKPEGVSYCSCKQLVFAFIPVFAAKMIEKSEAMAEH